MKVWLMCSVQMCFCFCLRKCFVLLSSRQHRVTAPRRCSEGPFYSSDKCFEHTHRISQQPAVSGSRSPTNTRNKMYIFEHKLRTFTKRKQVVFVPEPDKTETVYYHHLDDITHLTSSFLHVQIHSNFNSKNSSLHFGTKTSRRVDFQSLTTAVWAFRTLYCSELQRWSKRIKASICQESNTLSIQKWMM